jgi:biotin transport system substrate-specific component
MDRPQIVQIVLLVGGFAVATAVGAQVRIPLPFTPVPITLQTFVVMLGGAVLGPGWGAFSIGLYIAAGAFGAPVFSGGGAGLTHLTGATAGYLYALPLAAYLAGWLTSGSPGRLRLYGALLLAGFLILGLGTLWLGLLFERDLGTAAALGFWPFLPGDIVKTVAAAELARLIGRRT